MRRVMLMGFYWLDFRKWSPALRSLGHAARDERAGGRDNGPCFRPLRWVSWGSSMRAFGRFLL